MIRDRLDAFIGVSTSGSIAARRIKSALDDVEQVRVNAVADEGVAVVVPVDTPRVRRTNRERFPLVTHGMIPPHPALESAAFLLRRARFSRHRPVGDAVCAVQPTVRPPGESIGDVVGVGVCAKPIQQHLRFSVRHAVVILVRDEIKVGDRHHPSAPEPHLDAAHVLEFVVKHDSFIVSPVPVGVLKDNNAIVFARFFVRIIFRLGHPKSPTVIDAKTNRLGDRRFTGKKRDVEPLRHLHCARRLLRGQRLFHHRLCALLRGIGRGAN